MTNPASPLIRDAVEGDLPAIVGLLADDPFNNGRDQATVPLDPGYGVGFAAIEADPRTRLVVLDHGDHGVIGTLQITLIPGLPMRGALRAEVEGLRIALAWRGHGFGQALMGWAIDHARAQGCQLIQLTSNQARLDAIRFYRLLGFSADHVGFKLRVAPP